MRPHCCKVNMLMFLLRQISSGLHFVRPDKGAPEYCIEHMWQTLEVHAQLSAHLGEISCNESHAYSEVCLIEIVGHIPAQLAILASFLHHCVEQRQYPDQWPECLRSQIELQAALCFCKSPFCSLTC